MLQLPLWLAGAGMALLLAIGGMVGWQIGAVIKDQRDLIATLDARAEAREVELGEVEAQLDDLEAQLDRLLHAHDIDD